MKLKLKRHGDRRIGLRFAFLPVEVKNRWIWFKFYWIEKRRQEIQHCGRGERTKFSTFEWEVHDVRRTRIA